MPEKESPPEISIDPENPSSFLFNDKSYFFWNWRSDIAQFVLKTKQAALS